MEDDPYDDNNLDDIIEGWIDQLDEIDNTGIDVRELESHIEVFIDATGHNRDEIEINFEKSSIEITSERDVPRLNKDITLPKSIDCKEKTEKFNNGILSLKLPKTSNPDLGYM